MELYLVRHAESELNVDRRKVGGRSSWCELTERGRAQARAVAGWLEGAGEFDLVASSTAVRAQQTARLSLEQAGWELSRIEFYRELEEAFYGEWEGAPRPEVYTPETVAEYRASAWTFRPPGGETLEEAGARLARWVDERVVSARVERALVYSHGMMIRAARVALAGVDPAEVLSYDVPNTCITHLVRREGRWEQVGEVALTQHLEGMGRLSGVVSPDGTRGVEESQS